MTREELKEKANDLPLCPGVYLMMDRTGKVIYVGKAKKLKNRVSQYFQDSAAHTAKTRQMVAQVDRFDTIFVTSEFEALVLENSLIKRHMPHYNILLKDDKGYPFVRLPAGPYPRFTLVNRIAEDGARYFGPFGGRAETRQAIDAVLSALRLPTCSRKFPRDIGAERPCLNFHMGRCDGFCRPEMTEEEYDRRIRQACQLLEGKSKQLLREMTAEMEAEAEALRFEQAAALRDRDQCHRLSWEKANGHRRLVRGYRCVGPVSGRGQVLLCRFAHGERQSDRAGDGAVQRPHGGGRRGDAGGADGPVLPAPGHPAP